MGENPYRTMESRRLRVAVIGSGNVATHLALALKNKCDIVQIYSRNVANASALADRVSESCTATGSPCELAKADVYIVSIKDDAIKPFLDSMPDSKKDALWLHTSGSVPRSVFDSSFKNSGVLYPLQTFSKDVELRIDEVSFFIEGSDEPSTQKIRSFAHLLSDSVYEADSGLRKKLHIAAVFACNFTNYMYSIADSLLEKNDIPFSVLIPLIKETTRKITVAPPDKSQTGPAYRGDTGIIASHLSMLSGTDKEIYELLSNAILKRYSK